MAQHSRKKSSRERAYGLLAHALAVFANKKLLVLDPLVHRVPDGDSLSFRLVLHLAARRQVLQLPFVLLQFGEGERRVPPDGFRPPPLPLVPEQVILGFRVLFLAPVYERDQRLQVAVVGGGGAGKCPVAVGLADVEIELGGLVCHDTQLSAESRIVKPIATNKLTAFRLRIGGEGWIRLTPKSLNWSAPGI